MRLQFVFAGRYSGVSVLLTKHLLDSHIGYLLLTEKTRVFSKLAATW